MTNSKLREDQLDVTIPSGGGGGSGAIQPSIYYDIGGNSYVTNIALNKDIPNIIINHRQIGLVNDYMLNISSFIPDLLSYVGNTASFKIILIMSGSATSSPKFQWNFGSERNFRMSGDLLSTSDSKFLPGRTYEIYFTFVAYAGADGNPGDVDGYMTVMPYGNTYRNAPNMMSVTIPSLDNAVMFSSSSNYCRLPVPTKNTNYDIILPLEYKNRILDGTSTFIAYIEYINGTTGYTPTFNSTSEIKMLWNGSKPVLNQANYFHIISVYFTINPKNLNQIYGIVNLEFRVSAS